VTRIFCRYSLYLFISSFISVNVLSTNLRQLSLPLILQLLHIPTSYARIPYYTVNAMYRM
jgi:hypothetical protein